MRRNTLAALFVITIFGTIGFSQGANTNKDLADIAANERAFAAMAVKERWQTAFIAYFADDAIGFGPHPELTKWILKERGIPTTPRTRVFNWAPQFGDISSAGDMGYSTGPVLHTDLTTEKKVLGHGLYFSVWQKQTDGAWKVAIDIGVNTPSAIAPLDVVFTPTKTSGWKGSSDKLKDDYRELDTKFTESIAKTSPLKAYNSRVDGEFHLYRDGMMPVSNKAGLSSASLADKFELIGGKIAKSSDFAYTYGKYMRADEIGYYVHVWRRDAKGVWRLVADVQNALQQQKN